MLGGLFTLENIKRISTVSNNSQSTQNVRGNIINNENNNMYHAGLILFVSFCFQENMPIFTYDWNALGWHKVDKCVLMILITLSYPQNGFYELHLI